MIDLHTHTKCSDGTWSIKEMLENANNAGIKVLSITDHDTVKAQKELAQMNYKEIFKGKLIPGIEFSTVYDGVFFHLLAYNFDYSKLEDWIYEKYESKQKDLNEEFNMIMESCKKNNIKVGDLKYDKKYNDENKRIIWPVDVIVPEIKKYPENKKYFTDEQWNDAKVFFQNCVTNKKFPAYIDFSVNFPKADEVAKMVRNAGGKLFIAHSYRYYLEDTIEFIDTLRKDNIIDGVEIYHSSFTKEQSDTLKKYCIENSLLMSGGTDCHGEKKPNIKLGVGYGNMNIDEDIISNWEL